MAQLKKRFERISQGRPHRAFGAFPPETPVFLEIPAEQVRPDPRQPRKEMGDLEGLKASIAACGVLQPLVVSPDGPGSYLIIAGERRYTAARALGLATLPAVVRTVEEHQRLELQLVENLHRKDLNPLEEAASYRRLMDEFGLTQEQVAGRLGRSVAAVNQTLRLLDLPERVREEFQTSENVSKSLLLEIVKAKNERAQTALWEEAKRGGLTVKQARRQKEARRPEAKARPAQEQITTSKAVVVVRFRKARVTKDEIRQALREALKQVG
jgi:ParB family transcriptional regulator, chromosome partitioning protein